MEEATAIATEYLTSLENIPAEVQHLLAEIRMKEDDVQEIYGDIQSRSQRAARHTVRGQSNAPLPDLVDYYTKLDALTAEKVLLARKIADIIRRAAGRLDIEIARALAVTRETASQDNINLNAVGGPSAYVAASSGSSTSATARGTIDKLKDSLKAEVLPHIPHTIDLLSPLPAPTPLSGGPLKKRRLNPSNLLSTPTQSASFSSPSSGVAPNPQNMPPHYNHTNKTSRLNIHISHRRDPRSQSVSKDDGDREHVDDHDGVGDDDDDSKEFGDPDDPTLYCYCRKMSYGEMVGCDNEDCPYQWFHLSCTGIKGSLPESWYCSDCAPKFRFGGPSEKTRKRGRPKP